MIQYMKSNQALKIPIMQTSKAQKGYLKNDLAKASFMYVGRSFTMLQKPYEKRGKLYYDKQYTFPSAPNWKCHSFINQGNSLAITNI